MKAVRSALPLLLLLSAPFALSQAAGPSSGAQMPPDYRGPQVRIPGIFVTPVAGAPFSASVEIVSTQVLPNGTSVTRKTINHIARETNGRIYNERRALVPASFQGVPPLIAGHIYDPSTRLSIFTAPMTRLAREMYLPPARDPSANPNRPHPTPNATEQDLGTQELNGVPMKGIRKSRTIPAVSSGTGKEVVVSDEYWYSAELSIYMLIKHDDPRSGTQYVAVTQVDRHEPDAALFTVPPNYKVVDETPPTVESAAAGH